MTPSHQPCHAGRPSRATIPTAGAAVALAACVFLIGCTRAARPGADAGGPLGPERPPAAPLTADDAYPQLRARDAVTLSYRITDGQDAERRADLLFTSCDRLADPPRIGRSADRACILWTVAPEDAPRNTRLWARVGSGLIVMGIMLNPERGVVTTFEPPLVIFPAGLEPGAPFTQTVGMKVTDERGRPKEQGSATLEMTLVAVQDLTLAGRTVETARVRSVFRANLRNARIIRTTDRWHIPGVGPVMEHFDEEVRAFGLVIERTSQTFILDGDPPPAAPNR